MLGVSKKQLVMVAVLLSGTLLAVLNQTFLSPALPTIMRDLNISTTTAQWLTSGYSLTEAVIIPLSAFLMGRFKTRTLFVGGMTVFAIGSGLCAAAPCFEVMLLGRVLQAACTGAIMPMVTTVILLVFPREKRGTAMGVIGLIIGFAPAIGPSCAGLMIDSVGWRILFVIVFSLAVLVIFLGTIVLSNYGNFERVSFDVPSVIMSSLGLVCLLYGLSSFSSSTNLVLTLALIAVGIVMVALFARRQLKLDQPMLRISILKTPQYRKAVCIILMVQLSLMGMGVIMPLYIQGSLGQSATVSGLVMLPGALMGALFGLVAGTLFDRFGARKVAIPGSLVMLIGAAGLPMLGVDTTVVMVTCIYTILVLGLQMTMNPINTWGLNSLDNSVLQHAQSLSNTLNQVAGSFGTALLVSLSALGPALAPSASTAGQTMAGYHLSFTVTAVVLAVVVVVIAVLVRETSKTKANPATASASTTQPANATGIAPFATVADAMNPNSPSIPATASMHEVVKTMARKDVGDMPVVDKDLHVVGFISDADVTRYLGSNDIAIFDASTSAFRFVADGNIAQRFPELFEKNVMSIAVKRVVTISPTDPLDYACRIMAERKFKKLPVVQDGVYVGSLSRRNVVQYLADVW